MWRDLGTVHLTEALKERIVAGTDAEIGAVPIERIAEQRDELLVALLGLKARSDKLP